MSLTRRLVEILTARSTGLSGQRRQRSRGLADFGIADVANFWLLYTINTNLPVLRHYFEAKSAGHPGELFSAMTALAGSLSTFSDTIRPQGFPTYDHGDLGGCFTTLDLRVRELLETVVPTNFKSLTLEPVDQPHVLATAIKDRYLAGRHFYLAVKTSTSQAEALRKAPHLLKVSAGPRMGHLIKQSLSGVTLTHAPTPPPEIPIQVDYRYFKLETMGNEWEEITRAGNLAVYVPADFADTELELLIVLPDAD